MNTEDNFQPNVKGHASASESAGGSETAPPNDGGESDSEREAGCCAPSCSALELDGVDHDIRSYFEGDIEARYVAGIPSKIQSVRNQIKLLQYLNNRQNKKEQFIHIDTAGNKFYYSDREMEILHREDGPATDYVNGDKAWWINGKRHREDGPAIDYASGYRAWWINNNLHREDGPAIEYADGSKEWCLNGDKLTEEEFNERIDPPEVTLTYEEIAAMFNVRVDKLKIKK